MSDEYRTPDDEPWSRPDRPRPQIADDEFERADVSGIAEAPPRGRGRFSALAVVGAGLLGGLVGAALLGAAVLAPFSPLAVRQTQDGAGREKVTIRVPEQTAAVTAVARKVTPSVVNLSIQAADMFGNLRSSSNGSGVIIRSDGYILTNNHVVQGADRVLVRIGPKDYSAQLVGRDPTTDLAVVKVPAESLPAAEFGDSSKLEVGDLVVAVGSPFGLDKTVTSGIVSALHRSSLGGGDQDPSGLTQQPSVYTNLIQTDAAINPGNSGGALADAEGRIIGINTLIASPSGGVGAAQSAGIGFAIPIDFAKNVADQIIKTGRVTHALLGVGTIPVDGQLAAQFGLPVAQGALIQQVQPDSPAAEAGLQRGDIVVSIGGKEVVDAESVFVAVRSHQPGANVAVVYYRGTERKTIQVVLGSDAPAK